MKTRAVIPLLIVISGVGVCLLTACYLVPMGKVGSSLPPSSLQGEIAAAATLPQLAPVAMTGTVSGKDATDHFMDLTFAEGRTRLTRLPYYDPGTHPKNTISIANDGEKDRLILRSFIMTFNKLSATNQFSDVILSNPEADIVIQYVTTEGMKAIPTEAYNFEILEKEVSLLKVGEKKIYINTDLNENCRNYALIRGLLYRLGLKGESMKHTDSIFYHRNTVNYHLSPVDVRAIELLYSMNLSSGMRIEDVRVVVYASG